MIKQILIILLGLFFIINGINHFYNSRILKAYAEKKSLIKAESMVYLSGVLLLAGGLSMITGFYIIPGIYTLCFFLIVAAFSIHKFWQEKERELIMLEFMHFLKNFAIMFELIYIANSLEG
jgi:putative oxidoreductase